MQKELNSFSDNFEMKTLDEDTIIIERKAKDGMTTKRKQNFDNRFAKISLQLFDEAYIKELQKIEANIYSDLIRKENRSLKERTNEILVSLLKKCLK